MNESEFRSLEKWQVSVPLRYSENRIQYLLKDFSFHRISTELHYKGTALFSELPGSPSQERRWQRAPFRNMT